MKVLADFNYVMENNDDESQYTDYKKCKKCAAKGNSCCAICPCEIHPDDLTEVTAENIILLLRSGYVTIDFYDYTPNDYDYFKDEIPEIESYDLGDRIYFLRMKSIYDGYQRINLGWGGKCIALGENGCELQFKHRPFYGRRMNCDTPSEKGSKIESCIAWFKYNELLEDIAYSFKYH